jgi:hypothetical protein
MGDRLRARSLETRYRPPRSAEVSPEVIRRALERGIAVVVNESRRSPCAR